MLTQLLTSPELSLRFKALTGALRRDPADPELASLRREIAASPRVQALLSGRDADGTIPERTYRKWTGAHWVLVDLANLGYPSGDAALWPLVDQNLTSWTSRHAPKVPLLAGHPRR